MTNEKEMKPSSGYAMSTFIALFIIIGVGGIALFNNANIYYSICVDYFHGSRFLFCLSKWF